jgi:hypothetical protein
MLDAPASASLFGLSVPFCYLRLSAVYATLHSRCPKLLLLFENFFFCSPRTKSNTQKPEFAMKGLKCNASMYIPTYAGETSILAITKLCRRPFTFDILGANDFFVYVLFRSVSTPGLVFQQCPSVRVFCAGMPCARLK